MKLCHASNSSIISTSANITGKSPIKNIHVLRKQLQNQVDFILPGVCGPITGPTEIRVLKSGKILRPANS
jgi:tRNA A37 threonylcarbamoyladenosine synthetase subunit TsaC/SUA5/YrdC